ncbi:MAG: hypothetical protein ACLFN5_02400 [bacterium]
MKSLWKIWTFMINITLIFLPLVIAGLLIFYYGQPIAGRFRDFLGNPVTEFVGLAENFQQRQPDDELYEHAGRLLSQLAPREELTEKEMQQLRESVFKIHRVTVELVGLENRRGEDTDFFEIYNRFLDNRQLERLFVHSSDLRTNLRRDLKRMQQLTKLPFHPARGLEAYLDSSDTPNIIVRDYGSIYADQYSCRQIFTVKCDNVYSSSTRVAAQQISQYLTSWPQPGRGGDAGIIELNDKLLELSHTYQKLTREINGYLQATPWEQHKDFITTQENFREYFIEDMRLWYKNSIEELEVTPRQFTETAIPDITSQLIAIKEIEETLATKPENQQMLLSEENRAAREKLKTRLLNSYSTLLGKQHFKPQFEISIEKLQGLRETISSFPEGEDFIKQQNQVLDRVKNETETLVQALEEKNYSLLNERLALAHKNLEKNGEIIEEIMISSILSDYLDTFNDPDWLPVDRAGQQEYSRLINRITELGEKLDIDKIDSSWQRKALVAMRSRRFTVLKKEIESILIDGDNALANRLKGKLHELLALQDLPETLIDQPQEIVLNSALSERIHNRENKIYEEFQELFETDNDLKRRWQQVNSTLEVHEQMAPGQTLEEINLRSYVREYIEVLEATDKQKPLAEIVSDGLISRLEQLLTSLARRGERWLRTTELQEMSYDDLNDIYDNLLAAVNEARQIEGFSFRKDPRRWKNLLTLRELLFETLQRSQDLSAGQLIGENTVYVTFKESLENYSFEPLPDDYDFDQEKQVIRYIQRLVLEKATEIEKEAEGQWLAGWGGRLQGDQVLEPWENFMNELRSGINDTAVRTFLREYSEQTLDLRQEWQ